VTKTFSPGDYNLTQTCGSKTVEYQFSTFGSFMPMDRGMLRVEAMNMGDGCPDYAQFADFIVGSLMSPPDGKTDYQIKVQIDGWFGLLSNPTARFKKVFTFKTQ
jgi:hypothetical protein